MVDWTILNGFDPDPAPGEAVSTGLRSRLEQAGKRCAVYTLREMNIAPCRSCGACGYRSPGQCVVNDDLHAILRSVAHSQVVVFLSPIRFGGYASQLKKVVEKFMVLGMPYYMVRDGHLLHPMRYGQKSLISIGVVEADLPGQEECFRLLLERNATNLLCPKRKAVVVRPDGLTPATLSARLDQLVGEAMAW